MDAELQYKLIHPVKYYRDYINYKVRPDCRTEDAFRPVIINVNSITTANGSAVAKVGNTTVVCGIKAELTEPKVAEPTKGFIVPNIELSPVCSPKYRPGAPTEEAQVYSQNLAEIIQNSKCINLNNLCIVKEKLVWCLFCDLVCLDHDGCVLDAAVIAFSAALKTLKLPKVTHIFETNSYVADPKEIMPINIGPVPVATTIMVFDNEKLITDPNTEEEALSSSLVTVAVQNSEMCCIFKPGGSPLSAQQMERCIQLAIEREKSVKSLIDAVVQKAT